MKEKLTTRQAGLLANLANVFVEPELQHRYVVTGDIDETYFTDLLVAFKEHVRPDIIELPDFVALLTKLYIKNVAIASTLSGNGTEKRCLPEYDPTPCSLMLGLLQSMLSVFVDDPNDISHICFCEEYLRTPDDHATDRYIFSLLCAMHLHFMMVFDTKVDMLEFLAFLTRFSACYVWEIAADLTHMRAGNVV